MPNGVEGLEEHLAGRRRRGAPASRNSRTVQQQEDAETEAARVAEERAKARQQREAQERARREAEEAAATAAAAAEPLASTAPLPVRHEEPGAEPERSQPAAARPEQPMAIPRKKRTRPKATPVYLDDDLEDWLWEIKQTAARLHVDVPVSAVARKAIRELMRRQTPAQVVAELSSSPDLGEGKRGRPRR